MRKGTLIMVARHATPPTPSRAQGRRAGCSVTAVAVAVLAGALLAPPAPAHAEIAACRADPVVVLSNGVSLDLNAYIGAAAAQVEQVSYTLHAPAGTSVVSWTTTPGVLGPKEVFTFAADNGPRSYDTDTVVTTVTRGVRVLATTTVVPAAVPALGWAAGHDRQDLWVHLSP